MQPGEVCIDKTLVIYRTYIITDGVAVLAIKNGAGSSLTKLHSSQELLS